MPTQQIHITITPEVIDEWKREYNKLGEKIKALEERRQILGIRLQHIQYFIDDNSGQRPLPGIPPEMATDHQPSRTEVTIQDKDRFRDMSLPEAVRIILSESGAQTKGEVREKLLSGGFPKERFGPGGSYYYTVISRMRERGKILKEGDRLKLLK